MFLRRAGVIIMIQSMVGGGERHPLNLPHAIIFDLDGTLVDSLDDITAALNTALRAADRPPAAREIVRTWVGDGLPMLCRRSWPDAPPEALARLTASASKAYEAACAVHTRPYNNILQMLDLLKSRGVRMAVLSNKPHALAVRVIDELNLRAYFAEVHGYTSEEDKKPSPRVALMIAQRMGVSAAMTDIVGDSLVDIRTARAAGMRSISVTWGFQEEALLRSEGPDEIISDPMDLPRVIFEKFRE